MKPIYFYASRFLAYWVLLPLSIVLMLSISFNSVTEGLYKLYPLIISSIAAIIFTFIYMFRFISVSYSEIKYIGRFTSRDSSTINEGKSLVIELCEKNKVSLRLYGNEGYDPDIKWLTHEDDEDGDICTFRGKAYGGKSVARRLLFYFGVDDTDIDEILGEGDYNKTYENVTVSSFSENEHKHIKIRFDKTV